MDENKEVAVTSGNDLAEVNNMLSNFVDEHSRDDAEQLQGEFDFLPYMRLVQGDNCKWRQPPYEFQNGSFSLHTGKTEAEELGNEVDLMFLTWRPLAMNFTGSKPVGNTDQFSAEFKDWRARAEDPNEDVSEGYQWGYEFLVWLPRERMFATFWFANASGRRFGRYEIIGVKTKQPLLRQKLTIFSEKIEDKQENGKVRRYIVIKQRACNGEFVMPSMEDINKAIAVFKRDRNVEAEDDASATSSTSGESEER